MAWIKRNLAFVIGGVVALGLLVAAGFYIYQSWNQNNAARDKLNETYATLQTLSKKPVSLSSDRTNNTQIAQEQQKQLLDWMSSVSAFFQPIPSIPPGGESGNSAVFRSALATTIKGLQDEAANVSVGLSPNYGFSFEAYRNQLNLSPASLAPLSLQLGEVKVLADILLAARVNSLDSIQRLRISDSDTTGPAGDYLDAAPTTNELAILTPYAVTFRSFTPEISQVLAGFATSKYSMIVKSISVQPAGAAGTSGGTDLPPGQNMPMPGMPGERPYMPGYPGAGYPGAGMPGMGMPGANGLPPAGQPATSKGGLQTIIKEQLLRVTLQIEVVKLLPKK